MEEVVIVVILLVGLVWPTQPSTQYSITPNSSLLPSFIPPPLLRCCLIEVNGDNVFIILIMLKDVRGKQGKGGYPFL